MQSDSSNPTGKCWFILKSAFILSYLFFLVLVVRETHTSYSTIQLFRQNELNYQEFSEEKKTFWTCHFIIRLLLAYIQCICGFIGIFQLRVNFLYVCQVLAIIRLVFTGSRWIDFPNEFIIDIADLVVTVFLILLTVQVISVIKSHRQASTSRATSWWPFERR